MIAITIVIIFHDLFGARVLLNWSLAASQRAHDGVGGIVDDVVGRYRRQQRRSLSKDTTLQPDINVLKLFLPASMTLRHNRLERLSKPFFRQIK
jgi:hypothetical protein